MTTILCLMLVWPSVLGAQVISNGGMEEVSTVAVDADGRYAGWKIADGLLPTGWVPNAAYPGQLALQEGVARSGQRCVRLTATQRSTAHLYQVCRGLEAGKWYRVRAWVRGGPVGLDFYEYFPDRIGGQSVARTSGVSDTWRECYGYYRPLGEGYQHSALAIVALSETPAEVDDVSVDPADAPELQDVPPVVFETESFRLVLNATGTVQEFRCKATGDDYGPGDVPYRLLTAHRQGVTIPVRLLRREGDLVHAEFLDPAVTATVRVTERKHHLLFEVVDLQPQDVERVDLEIPMRRLQTVAWCFNGNYDERFGACLFQTTVNGLTGPAVRSGPIVGLSGSCFARHGIVGAKFALVAAPYPDLKAAIMETERENGLPCPMLGGEWARDSESVRKSYLFAVGVHEHDVDTLIEYAKLGGFGTLIIHKDDWLANHGNYDINRQRFPEGLASFKRAVDKIHAAGLEAGVHVFGPSISPDDPHVTPRPSDDLAAYVCPPLAEAVDEKATTLTLSEPPAVDLKSARGLSFPGNYLRVDDEIVAFVDIEPGPPYRFVGCTRGALGTPATPHDAGAPVRHLLNLWGYFVMDPDSALAEEITANFARLVNECKLDMVYFDASDCADSVYMDWWYYLNKMHLAYYSKFDHDVLYQTSMGPGSGICWHIVPRSASADGHGDIKGYLDERWPGILSMAANWVRADVGWYYMFQDVRPDQIEYVRAKTLAVDGSISIEASRASLESIPLARPTFEMLAEYDRLQRAGLVTEELKAALREPGRDFRLVPRGEGHWSLYEAAYEDPRRVAALDGQQNVWQLHNDRAEPCWLGLEIVRGDKPVPRVDYNDPRALTLESFDDLAPYAMSDRNDYEKFVIGGNKMLSPAGPVREGVTQSFVSTTEDPRVGTHAGVYSAENAGLPDGWSGIGRRLERPLDLSRFRALGLWIRGDGKGEKVRFQLRDTAGRNADWLPLIDYSGWQLHVFDMHAAPGFDWSAVEYILFYFNNIPAASTVQVAFDDLRALPELPEPMVPGRLVVTVGDRTVTLPEYVDRGQAVTIAGPGGARLWPGQMRPGRELNLAVADLVLQPGQNTVTLGYDPPDAFPGNLTVLVYRLWPLADLGGQG